MEMKNMSNRYDTNTQNTSKYMQDLIIEFNKMPKGENETLENIENILKEIQSNISKKQDELNLEKLKLDELKNQFDYLKEIVCLNLTN